MLGVVHACVGAGVGSLLRGRLGAFVAGVASHAVTDALPHKDCSPWVDVPLTIGALGAVALLRGADSPEFWGALGGIAPDAEHALVLTGLIGGEDEVFPTHSCSGAAHGRENGERWSQLAVAAVSLLVMARCGRKCVDTMPGR